MGVAESRQIDSTTLKTLPLVALGPVLPQVPMIPSHLLGGILEGMQVLELALWVPVLAPLDLLNSRSNTSRTLAQLANCSSEHRKHGGMTTGTGGTTTGAGSTTGTSSATGTGSTTGARDTTTGSSGHHLGRDTAIGGAGVGAAGVGAAE